MKGGNRMKDEATHATEENQREPKRGKRGK